ncbi:MAG: hypothetical protein DI533_04650 [Cereibacter sphaeroides]|uniref:N-acetyltransferase domain-containing protein n=1 Tax=Cereibacter sphaeroides TaxID=1063 RepID=A0A2W5SJT6_CERSP|nr:MAG: hypothetical protein DI533_04650 [Cereibacter sphaeroides]
MIQLRPYSDHAAMAVIQWLDPQDRLEAEVTRGAAANHLSLFADWRAMEGHRALSIVAMTSPARGGKPFALLALSNTGQAGVAEAALLARDHRVFRRGLAELAITIRAQIQLFSIENGIHRIEARCWARHSTAAGLLVALGFRHEVDMPGFGRTGEETFRQFGWTSPAIPPSQNRS